MDWDFVMVIVLKLLAVVLLVFLNGFFVATEFALVKVRATQLEPFAAKGHKRAQMALHLARHLDAYLSACQLGITLASLGLGWIGEPVFAKILEPFYDWFNVESAKVQHSISFGVGFSIITFLHIVVGEMAPKSLAIRLAMPTALWIAYPMHWFYLAMYPFIWVLNESALLILRLVGLEPAHESEGVHSEDELRLVLTSSQKQLGASRFSRDLVQNALELRHRLVRDVMRPRHEIVVLETEATIAQCLDVAEKSRFSRFPLCEEGNLDRMQGVVHIKDLYAMRIKARTAKDLLPTAKKLIYVPETARLEKLLQMLLDRRLHLAIVVDEYGGTVGLVTLENIVEELVGQIQDEFDQEKPLLTRSSETSWEVSGGLPLHELEELVGTPLQAEGVTTTSGWVTHQLGGFPRVGDLVTVGNCELRVEEMEGTRVARLRVMKRPASVQP
ncbi:MAG TPA: hemolysin family protein [Verrucomicrobiae bacterium]|nr:hemolysin family protein [Verrucomicrobiae bacterium]